MTSGKSIDELTSLALEAMRKQPNCSGIPYVTVCGLPELRDGRNWEIEYVELGRISIGDIVLAMKAVHNQLGPRYHLQT
jgi:hypothetical protein